MEELDLSAVDAGGVRVELQLQVSTPPPRVGIRLPGGVVRVYEDVDLFECLLAIRRDFEHSGLRLCCQGARPNVSPSGLSRQMTDGRLAYVVERGRRPSDDDLVDIFAPADCDEVVTIEAQRAAIRKLYELS